MKELFLLRGLPGCGKSTLALTLYDDGPDYTDSYETDAFFSKDGKYKFDPTRLREAHDWCKESVENSMKDAKDVGLNFHRIIVSNTFTQYWEMEFYYELAKKNGYQVYSIIVENRHGGVSDHAVPEETLEKMEKRFEVKLR